MPSNLWGNLSRDNGSKPKNKQGLPKVLGMVAPCGPVHLEHQHRGCQVVALVEPHSLAGRIQTDRHKLLHATHVRVRACDTMSVCWRLHLPFYSVSPSV